MCDLEKSDCYKGTTFPLEKKKKKKSTQNPVRNQAQTVFIGFSSFPPAVLILKI